MIDMLNNTVCNIDKQSQVDKKICLIIPFFGKLPNYFQFWLNSAAFNSSISWKLYTDDLSDFNYPINVVVTYESFFDFKSRIQILYDFQINIPSPYKLCDFRPAYGEIFEKELIDFDYWGFCDIDMIYGDIFNNIKYVLNQSYDKVFTRGHLTLIRNEFSINKLYRTSSDYYIKVFKSKDSFAFDECRKFGLNFIFKSENKNIFDQILFSDIFIGLHGLYPRQLMVQKNIKQNSIFVWDSGRLIRLHYDNSILHENEVIYVHLQKRKMKLNSFNYSSNKYLIKANEFISLNTDINHNDLSSHFSKKYFYFPYLYERGLNVFKRLITIKTK